MFAFKSHYLSLKDIKIFQNSKNPKKYLAQN
jgi:hypothetical protein